MSEPAESEREKFEKAAEEIAVNFCEGVSDKNLGSYIAQIAAIIRRTLGQAARATPQPQQERRCGNCGLTLAPSETEEQCREIFGNSSQEGKS